MMNYKETVEYILQIPLFAQKIGTENLSQLMERLGNPQDKPQVIHVAGTNGKGSTCKALATLLQAAGYKVGLFTSPHLVSINERIRINDELISDEDFVRCFETVKAEFDLHPSFFEVMFAMAAVYFEENQVDYVIYETGMGGRLDATNIVKPVLTIITSVGLDHMEYLGDTIEKIAAEKAGIIKPGVPVVYFRRDDEAAGIIETRAEFLNSPVTSVEISQYIINEIGDKTIDFSFHNRYYSYDHLKIKKTSVYQVENACLAIVSFAILMKDKGSEAGYIPKKAEAYYGEPMLNDFQDIIRHGLMDFSWEGRMEEVAPDIYVDGAHNVEAIDSYCKTLCTLHRKRTKILVFACVKDKDYETIIMKLVHNIRFEKVIITSVDSKRKASTTDIAKLFKIYGGIEADTCEHIDEAMEKAVAYQKQIDGAAIYCVGSLYLVGGVKKWIKDYVNSNA
jgi:dihydrofolate synthase/folylpolyglutamate synthase